MLRNFLLTNKPPIQSTDQITDLLPIDKLNKYSYNKKRLTKSSCCEVLSRRAQSSEVRQYMMAGEHDCTMG